MVQRRRAKTFSKSLWFQLAVVVAGVFGGYLAGIALVLAIDMFPPGACALMLTR